MKKLVLVLAILLIAVNINAQEELQVPQQLMDFYDYEGTWEGDAVLEMGGQTGQGTVKNVWTKISDGWGMLLDDELNIPLMGPLYIGHNILGYDIGEGLYHLYTVDNHANVHDHKGKMTGNTLYLEHNGTSPDGKSYKEEIYWEFKGKTEYSIKVNGIIDGEQAFVINMNLKKVN